MQKKLGRIVVTVLLCCLTVFWAFPTPVQAAPAINVSPAIGAPSAAVTVTGTGFGNETVSIAYDTVTQVSGITTNNTTWSATFNIPDSAYGSHNITATGTVSGVASTTFSVSPALAISLSSGIVGSSTTLTGRGFAASETGIAITYDGTVIASSITANNIGGWTRTLAVPASASGVHTFDAYGSTVSNSSVADNTFTVTPSISVSPTTAVPGSSISVVGTGFVGLETGITVTYDGKTAASGITASTKGGWTASFAVPASPAGVHSIDAYGASTVDTTVPEISFTTGAGIITNPAAGSAGSTITVTGGGFVAGETGIFVTYDGAAVVSNLTADSKGAFSTTFVVPASRGGAHTIDAYGSSTSAGTITDVTYTLLPGITISRTGGAPGSSISVSGSGFAASEKSISVTYDGTVVAQGISANANGGWTATFVVPESAAGNHVIAGYGSVTQAGTVQEQSFNIGAGLSLDQTSGSVGATITLTGSGFASSSPLQITIDDKVLPIGSVNTDITGSFTQSITIPKAKAGGHTIRVLDALRNDSKITFNMESTPPPIPVPISPKDGARVGISGDITPTFRWSRVTDDSGVTYILQVDTNSDFSQPILEKTDLTGSQYIVTASEPLSRGQYYWRVRAVDGASNQSDWSRTNLLKSGLMPLPLLIFLIVLAVAAVGGLIYFWWSRRPQRRWEGIPVPEGEMPRIIPGQYRIGEPDESRERPLPRLALPQPTRRAKAQPTLSNEDMARVKVIVDFAQSLPLVEPGYTSSWLIDLVETSMGIEASPAIYERLLKGEIQLRYEPAWMRHPTYQDLTGLLQGQPILQDLDSFVESVNRCTSDATSFLQDIYKDATAEIPTDFLAKGGWGFMSGVYADALSWFLGKSLREPLERDYLIKPKNEGEEGVAPVLVLMGDETTTFAGPLIEATDENEAVRLRGLHLKMRRTYRTNDKARQLVGMMTQLDVQRTRLINAFSQFSRLTQ